MRLVDLALLTAMLGAAAAAAAPHDARAEPPTAGGQRKYTAEQVRATVEEHVQRTVRQSGGVYPMPDDASGETLELEFIQTALVSAGALWRVHDPDHRVDGRAYLACLRFHLIGAPEEKIYDIDVRVEPRDGELAVTDARIHKEKRLVDGKWIWEARPARAGRTDAESR
jgi:hypothetical protein